MRMRSCLILAILILSTSAMEAGWTWKDGKFVDANEMPTLSAEEHYALAVKAYNDKDWNEASRHFLIMTQSFSASPLSADAAYFLGTCYFELQEYEFANNAFSSYIGGKSHPKYFIEAIEYKFCIAEAFRQGAKRRFFGTKQLPKWASGEELGVQIYDEVIAALPSHDFAARALYSKGNLLWKNKDYRNSIDCFQLLVKRFPKHELTPEAYLAMTCVYLDQSKFEFQNPDLLAFADLNVKRFKKQFPKEERIVQAENYVLQIKEVYAAGLYETGLFYERTGKPLASIIYYKNAIQQFPETNVAQWCTRRLLTLDPQYIPPAVSEEGEELVEGPA